jgi:hypothetical protein
VSLKPYGFVRRPFRMREETGWANAPESIEGSHRHTIHLKPSSGCAVQGRL